MAFTRAAGWNQFPNGVFTPVIYSQKVLKYLRRISVIEDITNTDYSGEIASFGDTVKIIKEPTVTVQPYARGSVVNPQDLYDDSTSLIIDHANAYAFKTDDIEERQSHINWEPLAASSAAYSLKDTFDAEVLSYLITQVDSGNVYGTNAVPISTGFGGGQTDPVNVIARVHRMLDDANVPFENRWLVARPSFYEALVQSPSKVMDMKVTGDSGQSQLRNGMWTEREVHGFKLYMSNNLPNPTGTATRFVLAGHMSAAATASQLTKTETFRDPDSFADVVRGLHMYGRTVLRPTALALAYLSGI